MNSAPDGTSGLVLEWTSTDSGHVQTLWGHAETEEMTVEIEVDLPAKSEVVWLTLRFTAHQDLSGIMVSRSIDTDPDEMFGFYETTNGASGSVAWSHGSLSGKALALTSPDGHAAVCPSSEDWCSTPMEVFTGSTEETMADDAIGVAVAVGDLGAGESAEVVFVYGLGQTVSEATTRAEEAAVSDDRDSDGHPSSSDCDDRDPLAFPGATEDPDGLDNDCDDQVDEDTTASDDDGDGWSEAQGDCDDQDATVFPGAEGDGQGDDDCDGADDGGAWEESSDLVGNTEEENVSGGCSQVPDRTMSPLLALIALVTTRRRR